MDRTSIIRTHFALVRSPFSVLLFTNLETWHYKPCSTRALRASNCIKLLRHSPTPGNNLSPFFFQYLIHRASSSAQTRISSEVRCPSGARSTADHRSNASVNVVAASVGDILFSLRSLSVAHFTRFSFCPIRFPFAQKAVRSAIG